MKISRKIFTINTPLIVIASEREAIQKCSLIAKILDCHVRLRLPRNNEQKPLRPLHEPKPSDQQIIRNPQSTASELKVKTPENNLHNPAEGFKNTSVHITTTETGK